MQTNWIYYQTKFGKVPESLQQKYRRKDWDIGGYNDLYKTNLYRWTQKYGTFENP